MMSSMTTDDDAVGGGGETASVGRCGSTVRTEKTQLRRSATVVVVALAIVMTDRSLDAALARPGARLSFLRCILYTQQCRAVGGLYIPVDDVGRPDR